MRINLLIIVLFWINSVVAQDIQIVSDFESASIGSLKQVAPNKFRGQTMHWIKHDQIGNQYYWFYFKVINVKNKTVDFELNNLVGVYRGGSHICYTDYTQPVISYDNETWKRIENVEYDEESKFFRFSALFEKDTAWIAYAHPYPYSRLMRYLGDVKSNPFLSIIKEGNTPESKTVSLIEITNPQSKKNKKNVFIMAMQHPGEDAGGYSVEGIINFLLSDNIDAQQIRDDYIYYIIPMMNPDGVYHGISRYSPLMQDFNNEWISEGTEKLDTPAEVEFVRQWISEQYKNDCTIDIFIDLHCHLQKNRSIAFLDRSKETEALNKLADMMNNYWPHVTYSYRHYPARTAVIFFSELNIPSLTVEFTQSYESEGSGNYLNIDDYRLFGKELVKAISDFFTKYK